MPSAGSYCYIHIGAPKTGSTFLQRSFFENREVLRRSGVLYPDVSLRGFGHHDIAFLLSGGYPEWATRQDRPLAAIAAELSAAISSHNGSLLLSSENFFLCPAPQQLKQMLESSGALAGRPARMIVYLRPQDDAHESWYNQRVKALGEAGPIEESIERFRDLWDYEKQLDLWSAVFGDEALVVRRYLPPSATESPLLSDMMGILKIRDFNSRLPPNEVNVAENRDILSFQRHINRLPLSPQQKRRFHRELVALSHRAKGKGLFDERPLLGANARATIMKYYAAGNSAVARKFFGSEPLFSATPDPRPGDCSEANQELTTEKMLYILGWVLAYKADEEEL